MSEHSPKMDRRNFAKLGAGITAMTGASLAGSASESESKTEMKYRILGRTKLKVSEVSFGTYGFSNSGLLEEALNKGINFICTCAEYQNGRAEESVGKALKNRRKDVVILTGCTVKADTTKSDILKKIEISLKRLNTDHIEIYKSHMIDDPKVLDNDAQYEAFEQAKKEGKVRFWGISGHGGKLDDVLAKAIEKEIDVIHCKYNFMEYAKQEKLLAEAAKKGIASVVFKVQAGKRQDEIKDLESKGLTLKQASVRWALKNESVSSVCGNFSNFRSIDEYIEAVSKEFSQADSDLLRHYAQAVDHDYCRYCSTCEPNCPNGVAVADIMRYSMYFKYYKMEKEAMNLYSQLPVERLAMSCSDCTGHCVSGCPHQRSVQEGLLEAHQLLT